MGIEDKFGAAAQDAKGKAKEAIGKATGDEQTEADGKLDQIKSDIKEGVEKVKDKVSETFNKMTD